VKAHLERRSDFQKMFSQSGFVVEKMVALAPPLIALALLLLAAGPVHAQCPVACTSSLTTILSRAIAQQCAACPNQQLGGMKIMLTTDCNVRSCGPPPRTTCLCLRSPYLLNKIVRGFLARSLCFGPACAQQT
jgi:hypothetical protein